MWLDLDNYKLLTRGGSASFVLSGTTLWLTSHDGANNWCLAFPSLDAGFAEPSLKALLLAGKAVNAGALFARDLSVALNHVLPEGFGRYQPLCAWSARVHIPAGASDTLQELLDAESVNLTEAYTQGRGKPSYLPREGKDIAHEDAATVITFKDGPSLWAIDSDTIKAFTALGAEVWAPRYHCKLHGRRYALIRMRDALGLVALTDAGIRRAPGGVATLSQDATRASGMTDQEVLDILSDPQCRDFCNPYVLPQYRSGRLDDAFDALKWQGLNDNACLDAYASFAEEAARRARREAAGKVERRLDQSYPWPHWRSLLADFNHVWNQTAQLLPSESPPEWYAEVVTLSSQEAEELGCAS